VAAPSEAQLARAKSSHVPACSADLLKLDNQLCFALYAATRAMTRTYRERLGPIGLTYPQYLVLIVLWENDGLTISQLGQRLLLDSGTLTPLLKRLEAAGVVNRNRRESDEREVEIWLTDKGRDMQRGAAGARELVVCRLAMPEAEIAALRRELMDIVDRLGAESVLEAEDI
jgi:MarR family transcriptional regulator, organic hydroperoxide resistance regulator